MVQAAHTRFLGGLPWEWCVRVCFEHTWHLGQLHLGGGVGYVPCHTSHDEDLRKTLVNLHRDGWTTKIVGSVPHTRTRIHACRRYAWTDYPFAALGDVPGEPMDEVSFAQRTRIMYGRYIRTPRLEAWHGSHAYEFGGSALPARELSPALLSVRVRLEYFLAGVSFDGCLVNLYRDGGDTVGWHADDEPEMGDPVIAGVSLGAARDICFRRVHRTPAFASAMLPNKLKLNLAPGSLFIMARGVQSAWQHTVPRRKRVSQPRVSLTYRSV